MPTREFKKEIGRSVKRMEQAARELGGANEGPWVVVATMPKWPKNEIDGIPVLHRPKRLVMRRYNSAEEAVAASVQDSAARVGGGWALNLETGATVRIAPFQYERHV